MNPPRRLLCIDPGAHHVGFAILACENPACSRVERAGFHRFESHHELSKWLVSEFEVDMIVVERPKVYPFVKQQGEDQNDLISVALTAGAAATISSRIKFLIPRDWKGTQNKTTHNEVTLRVLAKRPEGQAIQAQLDLVPKSVRHNAIDAVGIALWCADRLAAG